MKSRFASLALLHIKSSLSISFPTKTELKDPKKIAKAVGIVLLVLVLVADFGFIFGLMNVGLYNGLAPAGMQSLMLLNAATMAALLVFVFAFLMALSMFSASGIESGFLVLPLPPREMLAAKMCLVYVTSAMAGIFIFLVTMGVYGVKERPPFLFYPAGLLTALALPLLPTALSYLILIPFTKLSNLLSNKNFILYVGGFMGMAVALGFNFYLQSAIAKMGNPEAVILFASPDSLISKIGQAWFPSWLAWKTLTGAGTGQGLLALAANLVLGAGAFLAVAWALGPAYVRSLQSFGESTSRRKAIPAGESATNIRGAFKRRPAMASLALRELRLMNREPMYLLNGPFIVILMPIILAVMFFVQKDALTEALAGVGPILAGPAGYLVFAAFGGFLGSSTSIACTSLSRDARFLPWIRALPISARAYFGAKLLHAEIFAVFGAVVGSIGVFILPGAGLGDALLAFALGLLFSTAVNMGGLWLDAAFPRLSWDNPIAAMKQNPNAVIAILAAMGMLASLGFLSAVLNISKLAFAMLYGGVFLVPIILWILFFPRFAERKMNRYEG
jgi:ABC-2 type transport system permease protein